MADALSELLRPQELADLIQPLEIIRGLERMVAKRTISNMLFYGRPGLGKTSAARILLHEIDASVYEVNGSVDNGMALLRGDLPRFCSTFPLFQSGPRVLFIEECDGLRSQAQHGLRNFTEKYAECRFLLTANNIGKLHPALKSRCTPMCFDVCNAEAGAIIDRLFPKYQRKLKDLGIEIASDRLKQLLHSYFPDLRALANRIEFECGSCPVA